MVASMTAFARCTAQGEWGQAIWEIRSVNHRYLDLNFKISDNFREWEQSWRHLAAKILHRGKVDCLLTILPSEQTGVHYQLNKGLINQLISHQETIMQCSGVRGSFSAFELLRWPEVLLPAPQDLSFLKSSLTDLFEKALTLLESTRVREGEAIAQYLIQKLNQMLVHLKVVKKQVPECSEALRQKIIQRVEELQITLDPQRLEQELVLYIQRTDVEEELERLQMHVKEAIRVIEQKEPMGRRLDFLMQEMGREANTLASKSQNTSVTQEAIELKVLIEQMREQIQNVE